MKKLLIAVLLALIGLLGAYALGFVGEAMISSNIKYDVPKEYEAFTPKEYGAKGVKYFRKSKDEDVGCGAISLAVCKVEDSKASYDEVAEMFTEVTKEKGGTYAYYVNPEGTTYMGKLFTGRFEITVSLQEDKKITKEQKAAVESFLKSVQLR